MLVAQTHRSQEPGNLQHRPDDAAFAIKALVENVSVKRLAVFQSSKCPPKHGSQYILLMFLEEGFCTWMPHIHEQYSHLLQRLTSWKNSLKRNYEKSVFCAITFNFGPNAVCVSHLDHLNAAWGGCAITSGGNYNYVKGGHLILYSLRLIIEFPPACTFIVPSATIPHGNSAIQPDETHFSITQYTAGGLFRWDGYGNRTAKALAKEAPTHKAQVDMLCDERWKNSISLYSTLDELEKYWDESLDVE